MAYVGPQLLAADHLVVDFDCGEAALNDWLKRRAFGNQQSGTTRTWAATETGSHEVVAFYASCTGSILRSTAPKRIAQGQPEQLPAFLLARMGVDQKHQGRGVGAALLKHFVLKAKDVSASVGVRLLLVHAKDEAAKSFYEHYGFVASPVDPLTMIMLVDLDRLYHGI
ncbi:MAG: GNAT family N-acetyltransferase [Acidimicrobiales bacterium]